MGLLLKLLNCSSVDATTLVDQMTDGCRLARVDMSDNDNVDVSLLGTHVSQTVTVPIGTSLENQYVLHYATSTKQARSDCWSFQSSLKLYMLHNMEVKPVDTP